MEDYKKKIKCLYCGGDSIQKTAKARVFCSKKCKNANYIRLESTKSRARNKYKEDRLRLIKHYGGECHCCHEKRFEFLSFDHIEGGGNKHRKKEGNNLVNILKRENFPKNIRILCHNCNLSFGFYGYCPHGEI